MQKPKEWIWCNLIFVSKSINIFSQFQKTHIKINIFKTILKAIGILILLFFIGSAIYLYHSGPPISEEMEEIIEETLENPLPRIITGKTGFADNRGVKIWYESLIPKSKESKGAVLLIMGISNDALGWPPKFLDAFVENGYQVIRYDHRGTGMSDWLEDWNTEKPYSLQDMAADGIAVLDTLDISKAHIIGVSMGGMIAQELVIQHPDRAASLTSIMSSGNIFDPELPPISSSVAYDLIKVSLKYGIIGGEKNLVKLHLTSRMILMGNAEHELNVREITDQVLFNIRERKGYNAHASQQHQAAVMASRSRYKHLTKLSLPTLIVHGEADPFIPIAHGRKCASIVPNADSLWVKEMGHDIPDDKIERVANKIIANFKP